VRNRIYTGGERTWRRVQRHGGAMVQPCGREAGSRAQADAHDCAISTSDERHRGVALAKRDGAGGAAVVEGPRQLRC
jgi:hypothetical protein